MTISSISNNIPTCTSAAVTRVHVAHYPSLISKIIIIDDKRMFWLRVECIDFQWSTVLVKLGCSLGQYRQHFPFIALGRYWIQ